MKSPFFRFRFLFFIAFVPLSSAVFSLGVTAKEKTALVKEIAQKISGYTFFDYDFKKLEKEVLTNPALKKAETRYALCVFLNDFFKNKYSSLAQVGFRHWFIDCEVLQESGLYEKMLNQKDSTTLFAPKAEEDKLALDDDAYLDCYPDRSQVKNNSAVASCIQKNFIEREMPTYGHRDSLMKESEKEHVGYCIESILPSAPGIVVRPGDYVCQATPPLPLPKVFQRLSQMTKSTSIHDLGSALVFLYASMVSTECSREPYCNPEKLEDLLVPSGKMRFITAKVKENLKKDALNIWPLWPRVPLEPTQSLTWLGEGKNVPCIQLKTFMTDQTALGILNSMPKERSRECLFQSAYDPDLLRMDLERVLERTSFTKGTRKKKGLILDLRGNCFGNPIEAVLLARDVFKAPPVCVRVSLAQSFSPEIAKLALQDGFLNRACKEFLTLSNSLKDLTQQVCDFYSIDAEKLAQISLFQEKVDSKVELMLNKNALLFNPDSFDRNLLLQKIYLISSDRVKFAESLRDAIKKDFSQNGSLASKIQKTKSRFDDFFNYSDKIFLALRSHLDLWLSEERFKCRPFLGKLNTELKSGSQLSLSRVASPEGKELGFPKIDRCFAILDQLQKAQEPYKDFKNNTEQSLKEMIALASGQEKKARSLLQRMEDVEVDSLFDLEDEVGEKAFPEINARVALIYDEKTSGTALLLLHRLKEHLKERCYLIGPKKQGSIYGEKLIPLSNWFYLYVPTSVYFPLWGPSCGKKEVTIDPDFLVDRLRSSEEANLDPLHEAVRWVTGKK